MGDVSLVFIAGCVTGAFVGRECRRFIKPNGGFDLASGIQNAYTPFRGLCRRAQKQ
jgi:hypothetical protein